MNGTVVDDGKRIQTELRHFAHALVIRPLTKTKLTVAYGSLALVAGDLTPF